MARENRGWLSIQWARCYNSISLEMSSVGNNTASRLAFSPPADYWTSVSFHMVRYFQTPRLLLRRQYVHHPSEHSAPVPLGSATLLRTSLFFTPKEVTPPQPPPTVPPPPELAEVDRIRCRHAKNAILFGGAHQEDENHGYIERFLPRTVQSMSSL